MKETTNRTCPVCHAELEDDESLVTLADLRYDSQGFIDHTCSECGALLSIQEDDITVYRVRVKESLR